MPIDSQIALGVKPFQPDSGINALAQILQIQQAQQANQFGSMKMDEMRRGQDGDRMLASLLASGKSPGDVATGLAGAGYGKQSLEYTKQQQDAAKDKAQTEHFGAQSGKLNQETLNLQMQQSRDSLNGVNDPQAAAQWVSSLYQNPTFAPLAKASGRSLDQALQDIPQDPQGFAQWKMQHSLGADKLIQMTTPDANAKLQSQTSLTTTGMNNATSLQTTSMNNKTSIQTTGMNNATTQRVQNMTDGRARDALEAGKQQIVQTDNGPVLVNTRTGSGMVVNGPDGQPLPGVTKPLNDSQSKALLFGSRMRDADKALATLSSEGKVNSFAGSRAPIIGGAINALSTDNNQMLNQAKTDFMTAVLRRESGAAISSGEFETADKQYFPQVGDAPGVIAQKASNRQMAIRGILMEVPEKQRNSLQSNAPASQGVTSGWSYIGTAK